MTKKTLIALALLAGTLAACSNIGIGISLPVGGIGHVGVGVDSSGRVGGQVGVGVGRGSVSVGGTGQIPPPAAPASAASAGG